MRVFFLVLLLALVAGCNQAVQDDSRIATIGDVKAHIKVNAKVLQDEIASHETKLANLENGKAELNVKSIKAKSVEADEVVINHGGKFELRSGARFVRDGKEEDLVKPAPKPGPSSEEIARLVDKLVKEELAKIKAKSGDEEPDETKLLEQLSKKLDKYFDRRDKMDEALEKLGERLRKGARSKPYMPPAKNGGSPPEAKVDTTKAWPLADNIPAALIPIAERRLRKTEEDYQQVLTVIAGKVAAFYDAPTRIQWPHLPNPYSPTVYL